MIREEEIINAATEARMASAETLTTRGTHHSIDDVPFIDKMITYDEVAENAFIKGAEWADEHQKNVWHDASEEPEKGELILVEVMNTIPKKNEVRYFVECVEEWVVNLMKTEGFQTRWAYISDLLPKGGEE